MPLWYWIDIETPKGKLEFWSMGAPRHQFQIAKALGYSVEYGKEGAKASRSYKVKGDEYAEVVQS